MKIKNKKPVRTKDVIVKELPIACSNEAAAVYFMEKQRWGEYPACPHCGSINVSKMTGKDGGRNKRFLWRCHEDGCKKQYTVRVGTVFEDSRVPLKIWCHAFWAACASKNGVSALQIKRECNVTYKTALFILHRIRYAMTAPKQEKKLQGTIEADETYVGGKPRFHRKGLRGRGTPKTPVLALVERNGGVRTRVIPNVTAEALKNELWKQVDLASRIITDEEPAYKSTQEYFGAGIKQYVIADANMFGAIFIPIQWKVSLRLKRGLYGTFHSVSKKHLHRYVSEFAFRWNTRQLNDGERIAKAIQGSEGKRLTYREPIVNA